ncbi:MAG: protoporphyrinogen oxidase [Verrucomicrobiota bacterium]|nr:protoporphyrinogen oxidase [Verrucomicrobiota bacterium]
MIPSFLILGGGISGLSAAWFLRKRYPDAKITLLEKESQLGGKIGSCRHSDFFFEKGPRTFSAARSKHLLALIREMDLEEQILYASARAKKRYLWVDGALRSPLSFWKELLVALLKEPFQAHGTEEDESIASFATRRFGSFIAKTVVDPIALGIYGANVEELSMRSCFPTLFFRERTKSLLPLFFRKSPAGNLFTLRDGMELLIQRLAQRAKINIHLGHEVTKLNSQGAVANGNLFSADHILSALPLAVIGRLTGLWPQVRSVDLVVAHLAYENAPLPKEGFGYLVPGKEKESLLGMIWESSLFPEQSPAHITRVTGILRQGDASLLQEAMKRHLSFSSKPFFSSSALIREALPLFFVGYHKHLSSFLEKSSVSLLGNYIDNPSVDGCIARSLAVVEKI